MRSSVARCGAAALSVQAAGRRARLGRRSPLRFRRSSASAIQRRAPAAQAAQAQIGGSQQQAQQALAAAEQALDAAASSSRASSTQATRGVNCRPRQLQAVALSLRRGKDAIQNMRSPSGRRRAAPRAGPARGQQRGQARRLRGQHQRLQQAAARGA